MSRFFRRWLEACLAASSSWAGQRSRNARPARHHPRRSRWRTLSFDVLEDRLAPAAIITVTSNLDETTVMQKLQHLDINTLGILWTRTPSNYESYSAVQAAMETINPDGSATLFK